MPEQEEAWHRRHAIQIAAQLPEEPKDAILVLEATRRLVDEWLSPQRAPRGECEAVVVVLPASRAAS